MRRSKFIQRLVVPALAAAAVATAILPVQAGGRGQDHVYADSFGNLVVDSAAGYKRIVVGQGDHVKDVAKYLKAGQPDVEVVYAGGDDENSVVYERGCYRPPALIKGRSYMYGFDQGEIPFQGGDCR